MEEDPNRRKQIINLLDTKALLKQTIYKNTFDAFTTLKDILHEMSTEINEELHNTRLIKMEYRDRGKFEAQLQVAGDMLIFTMHTNVFEFPEGDSIYKDIDTTTNPSHKYCGVINIYDFLSDSFKYNRSSDEGYLIARIFISGENSLFVEGKGQKRYRCETFEENKLGRNTLIEIIEQAILYAIDFDLQLPSYDSQKIIAVDQLNTKIENSKIQTSKLLGLEYNSEDI